MKAFGATGDGLADDGPAIRAAYAEAIKYLKPLYFPAGHYKITQALVFELSAVQYTGITIFGAGVGQSIIDTQAVPTSPQVLFTCTPKAPETRCDSAYLSVKEIAFDTRTSGTGVQFGFHFPEANGATGDHTDYLNETKIDLRVSNYDTSVTARAVELNALYNPAVRLVANTAGAGTGTVLRAVSFGHFTGSYGALLGTSIWLTTGFNDANVFDAVDMENVAVCVKSDSPYSDANTFVGGTWSYTVAGVVSTAGTSLLILNPGNNPAGTPTPHFVGAGGAVGLTVTPPKP